MSFPLGVAGIVGGTAIFGFVAAFWRQFLLCVNKIKALFIVGFKIQESPDSYDAIIFFLRNHYKCISARGWSFRTIKSYRKKYQRYAISPLRSFLPQNDLLIFIKKWSFVFVDMDKTNEGRNLSLWTFRFFLKPETLYQEAIEEWDIKCHNIKKSRDTRFYISYKTGNRGGRQDVPAGKYASPVEDSEIDNFSMKATLVPLGWEWNDVIQDGSSGREFYALTDELKASFKEAKFWLESKNWYIERGIPWRRAWMLTGIPGTGKTAFVRWMAKELDLPVISFDLSTYSNGDFVESWKNLSNRTPCIALIEDIDAVYNGRKNITDTDLEKGVTFDCFLNCQDGIQRNDGVFVIITTNRIEKLDSAIGIPLKDKSSSRPGRIDKILEILPLNMKQKDEVARKILCGFDEEVVKIVELGKNDTGAMFVERCRLSAEQLYWDQKKEEKQC